MEAGAQDASRFSSESEAAMQGMQRLLELSHKMEVAIESSAVLSNIELAVMSGLEQIVQRRPAGPAFAASVNPAQLRGTKRPQQVRLQRVA